MTLKQIFKSITPPAIWGLLKYVRRRLTSSVDCLTYAPRGWATKLSTGSGGEEAWAEFTARAGADWRSGHMDSIYGLQSGQSLSKAANDPAQIKRYLPGMECAYVFALAALHRTTPRILDYGGHLGDLYWLSKALLPGVKFDYHIKELPAVAEKGRKVSPEVIWHTDDACLAERYDLVIFSGTLQYVQDWQDLIRLAASATGAYLLLSQVSTVESVPGYVAIQRMDGIYLLHQQLNQAEVLATVRSTGLRLVREFMKLEHPRVLNAPEQPYYRGWLFQRDAAMA